MQPNEIIKKHIAPCGLHCGGCFAFNGGNIQKHSTELIKSLGNFDVYAQRFVTMLDEPVFENYQSFKMMLHYFSEAKCNGCREQACALFKSCHVRDCFREKGVDFVFNVPLSPANKPGSTNICKNVSSPSTKKYGKSASKTITRR